MDNRFRRLLRGPARRSGRGPHHVGHRGRPPQPGSARATAPPGRTPPRVLVPHPSRGRRPCFRRAGATSAECTMAQARAGRRVGVGSPRSCIPDRIGRFWNGVGRRGGCDLSGPHRAARSANRRRAQAFSSLAVAEMLMLMMHKAMACALPVVATEEPRYELHGFGEAAFVLAPDDATHPVEGLRANRFPSRST